MTTQTKSLDVSRLAGAVGNRVLAAIFLVYFAPVMLAVALLIKFDSHGPVFTRHTRRNANGELLALWEFRTCMADGTNLLNTSGYGSQTELGAFLCETRLDLLPRLVNMLRGEVSFGSLLR